MEIEECVCTAHYTAAGEGRHFIVVACICEKHIIIYDVDDAISILRVLDTRTDYIRAILSELSENED